MRCTRDLLWRLILVPLHHTCQVPLHPTDKDGREASVADPVRMAQPTTQVHKRLLVTQKSVWQTFRRSATTDRTRHTQATRMRLFVPMQVSRNCSNQGPSQSKIPFWTSSLDLASGWCKQQAGAWMPWQQRNEGKLQACWTVGGCGVFGLRGQVRVHLQSLTHQ